jgi:hypothetical protein
VGAEKRRSSDLPNDVEGDSGLFGRGAGATAGTGVASGLGGGVRVYLAYGLDVPAFNAVLGCPPDEGNSDDEDAPAAGFPREPC